MKQRRIADISAASACPSLESCTQVFQATERTTRRGRPEILIEDLGKLGHEPTKIMERVSFLRDRGPRISCKSDDAFRDSIDQLVPALLTALSALERQQMTRRTRETIQNARARGSPAGRPLVMTPERQAIAARMLSQGKRGKEILNVIRGLGVPNISQSAYYLWQKAWLARQPDGTHP